MTDQSTTNKNNHSPFLSGGGEMGELTRRFDWSKSPLGSPMKWPQSLQITLGNVLSSGFPMFLFWGSELICFYNDAFRPSLGTDGKHPALGKKGQEVWPEIWSFIGPLIEGVISTGKPVWFENQLVPFYRNGRIEEIYWTFSYSRVLDDQGQAGGVLVTCMETTQTVLAQKRMEVSEKRFQSLVREASIGIIVVTGKDLKVEIANESYLKLARCSYEDIIGKRLFDTFPKSENFFRPIIEGVMRSGEPFYLYDRPYPQVRGDRDDGGFLNLVFQPYTDAEGLITGVIVLCQDVTSQVLVREKIKASEQRLRNLIVEAPIGFCLISADNLVVEIANDKFIEVVGRAREEIVGRMYWDVFPEARVLFESDLRQVVETGEQYNAKEVLMVVVRQGKTEDVYLTFVFQALKSEGGEVDKVLISVIENTEQVLARKKIEESEAKVRKIIHNSPESVAIAVFLGRDLVIDICNKSFTKILGKGENIVGKPLLQVLPELENQPFPKLLDDVYTTGTIYQSLGSPANLMHNGVLITKYFNICFTPLLDSKGKVYAILDISYDVTEHVLAKKKLEEKEQILQTAISLAELGTWSLNLVDGTTVVSHQLAEMLGLDENQVTADRLMSLIIEPDRDHVRRKFDEAKLVSSGGHYDAEYRVRNAKNGKVHVVHASGQAYFDTTGNLTGMEGITRDITIYRELQLALEQEVRRRTEELQAANEELASTNEELSESTQRLIRTNEELNQFAYASSHDLQEPLRKIRIFSDRLLSVGDLSPHSIELAKKIHRSAERMSMLIRSLLEFSQLVRPEETFVPVDINVVIENVKQDLEFVIQEKSAYIRHENLPVIRASELQMHQLFHNLLSNSLKFVPPGRKPQIVISSQSVSGKELKMHNGRAKDNSEYFVIKVSDNGIGFDKQYADHIFEIFKRLHGRTEFVGSGIGLALCKRILTNHHGFIHAESDIGSGSTFHIFLPKN